MRRQPSMWQHKKTDLHTASLFPGGPKGIRTLDLSDAKRHLNLFCSISNNFWYFPLGFSFFPPLFRTLISMCYAAVCGVSCGQNRSPPFAGNGFPTWTESIFCVSDCVHCNSEEGIKQVFFPPSMPQKLGAVNKKAFCLRRLRKLKRILFYSIF